MGSGGFGAGGRRCPVVGLHVGAYDLGRHQPHLITEFCKLPSSMTRAGICLQADEVRRQISDQLEEPVWHHFPPKSDSTNGVHAVNL